MAPRPGARQHNPGKYRRHADASDGAGRRRRLRRMRKRQPDVDEPVQHLDPGTGNPQSNIAGCGGRAVEQDARERERHGYDTEQRHRDEIDRGRGERHAAEIHHGQRHQAEQQVRLYRGELHDAPRQPQCRSAGAAAREPEQYQYGGKRQLKPRRQCDKRVESGYQETGRGENSDRARFAAAQEREHEQQQHQCCALCRHGESRKAGIAGRHDEGREPSNPEVVAADAQDPARCYREEPGRRCGETHVQAGDRHQVARSRPRITQPLLRGDSVARAHGDRGKDRRRVRVFDERCQPFDGSRPQAACRSASFLLEPLVARPVDDVTRRADTLPEQPGLVIELPRVTRSTRAAQPHFELPDVADVGSFGCLVPVDSKPRRNSGIAEWPGEETDRFPPLARKVDDLQNRQHAVALVLRRQPLYDDMLRVQCEQGESSKEPRRRSAPAGKQRDCSAQGRYLK